MKKGLSILPLLESKILRYEFDYIEWPSTSKYNDHVSKPYNGSLFEIKNNFSNVFKGTKFDDCHHVHGNSEEKSLVGINYKIRYSINLIPSLGEYIEMD